MKVLIDRDAAIAKMCERCPHPKPCVAGCVAYHTLRKLPADEEFKPRIVANWFRAGLDYLACGNCKILSKVRSEYCPRCGAEMKKEVLDYATNE